MLICHLESCIEIETGVFTIIEIFLHLFQVKHLLQYFIKLLSCCSPSFFSYQDILPTLPLPDLQGCVDKVRSYSKSSFSSSLQLLPFTVQMLRLKIRRLVKYSCLDFLSRSGFSFILSFICSHFHGALSQNRLCFFYCLPRGGIS